MFVGPRRALIRSPATVASYTPAAVDFDGTNDGIASFTLPSDATAATLFFWWNRQGGDGTERMLFGNSSARTYVLLTTGNKIRVLLRTSAPATVVDFVTTPTYTAAGWHSLLVSFDAATTTGHIYIDDAAPALDTNTVNNATWVASSASAIGQDQVDGRRWYGYMAQPLIKLSYLDVSVEANRRKFITSANKPVDFGSDGSTPFGAQPEVYLNNPTATWHTNLGSETGFTERGALTDAATNPND